MNVLAYEPKTAAAQSTESLIGKVSAAGDQWKALGTALTIAFKEAYGRHEKTLKEVEMRFKSEDNNLMYFLFAAFVAGAVGGGVGLLIAPILNKAGQYVASRLTARVNRRFMETEVAKALPKAVKNMVPGKIERNVSREALKTLKQEERINKQVKVASETTVKGSEEVGVKATEKLEIDKFLAPADPGPPSEDTTIFKPAQTDPHQFDLERRHEIDVCVSHLKENIKRFQLAADNYQWGTAAARTFSEMMIGEDFIQKQPDKNEIQAATTDEKKNQAELGMWMAWAKKRDIDYWKTKLKNIKEIDRGADYLDYGELRKFDPIVERLKILKVDQLTTMAFKVTDPSFAHLVNRQPGPVLNIPALAKLSSLLGDPFLRRVGMVTGKTVALKDWVQF